MSDILFKQLIHPNAVFSAWESFRRGKARRRDVQEFERNLEDHLFALRGDLVEGAYRHGAYHRFHLFDPKHRVIHKATVRDRVVHHLLYDRLLLHLEPSFIFDSYSCRKEKGTHAAVRRLEIFAGRASRNTQRECWALKFDIRKFFDSVDHEILLGILMESISDPRVFQLVTGVVRSYVAASENWGGRFKTNGVLGSPLGT